MIHEVDDIQPYKTVDDLDRH